MKMAEPHVVPLSRQSVAILAELMPLRAMAATSFRAPRSDRRPMSDNAVLSALRRMGYAKDK